MIRKPRPPLTLLGKHKTSLDGQAISYVIKCSSRARCARLEIRPATGLTVVIPKSYSTAQIYDLLQKKKRWILNNLARYSQPPLSATGKELKSGDTIPYLGRNLEVVTRQNHENVYSAKLERNKLIVGLAANRGRLALVLEQWYRIQATQFINDRADKLSARCGISYNRLIIRGQKSRWGSCSSKGNLSFNWKLMMAPEPVIDYVIVHELLHLKEMNHTKKFWQLVAEHCPRWREHRKWLKDHEAELAAKLST
jgi:predicted metal-dependent hydrolase